jgi:hypothetical protein
MSIDERIAHIAESARRNRWATAGLELIELRKWYEASPPEAFAADERSWAEFVSKRLPSIAPADVERFMGAVLYRGGAMQCSACGAQAVCRCGCGAPYFVEPPWATPASAPVSARDRAVAAIQAAPEKSDRAIAGEIGVGHQTVGRARRRMTAAGVVDHPLDHPAAGRL